MLSSHPCTTVFLPGTFLSLLTKPAIRPSMNTGTQLCVSKLDKHKTSLKKTMVMSKEMRASYQSKRVLTL